MRRNWTGWLSAGLVLTACAPAVGAPAQQTTRVFAPQPKLDLTWMESRQTLHDKMFALADRTLRGPGMPLIQDGADDIASHLRDDGRNLVVWPEDIGLWAALTGQRGANARASGSLEGAVATLLAAYLPQENYYAQRYPAVAARVPQIRLLALALTDTFGRGVVETFSEMAAKYHVWLEAGVDMAQSWRVVCSGTAHPPQQPCDEQDAGKVAQLGDPEDAGRGYAYEATSPDASNMALVFDPAGKLVSKQVKTYITPIEVGQAEGQLAALDLVPGSVTSGLTAVPTAVGTLGFVTSKDAWMPDVLDRLEEAHVDVLVQPEFFVGDLAATSGMWAADTLKASGYSDLLRHPGFTAMALPSAVGNVFDFSADQQTHIVERPSAPGAGEWLIGQPPAPGLVGVTPWVVPDPVGNGEPFPERRKRLGEAGQKLAPGSGVACPDPAKPGPCENGHVETVLWRDVAVGTPPYQLYRGKRTGRRFWHAHRFASTADTQRNVVLAAASRYAVAAYEQRIEGRDRILAAASSDGGRHWSRPAAADPAAIGDQQWPALAVSRDGRVTVAWTARTIGPPRVVYAQAQLAARRRAPAFGQPLPIDPDAPPDSTQWKPALAQGAADVVHAAFIDTRARSQDAALPQAGVSYTRIDSGAARPARRLDLGSPEPLSAKLDNAWSPALAVRGNEVVVTWIDFMHYDWDALTRISHDGGSTFGDQIDLNREPKEVENLSDSPRPLFTRGGPLIAWTDFHKRDSSAQTPHPLYDIYLAAPGADPVQADPFGPKQASTFWPSVCGLRDDALVAFQDSSTGVGRIRVARIAVGTRRGHAYIANDSRANAYRPAMACPRGRVLVAWEDARNGPAQVYLAAARTRRIR